MIGEYAKAEDMRARSLFRPERVQASAASDEVLMAC
jgi:hypothetical protein